jgi:hypothetical protein
MSNNLNLDQLTESQTNKATSVNTATGQIDAAVTENLACDFTAGNIALTDTQFRRNISFSAINLSVARDLTVPAIKKYFFVSNAAGTNSLSVKRGTTTITLGAGEVSSFFTDGTANGLIFVGNSGLRPYDIGGFFVTVPGASEILSQHIFVRPVTLPINLTGSRGHANTLATALTICDIQKNGASIGSLRYPAATAAATFTLPSATSFAVGDRLSIIAPNTPDATLANFMWTLMGTRN